MVAVAQALSAHTPQMPDTQIDWRERFAQMLPAIDRHARICFRRLSPEARSEAVQEAVATAFSIYVRLVSLGKESAACAAPLANFAVRRAKTGRSIGGPVNADDITSKWCQRRRGIQVERLDQPEIYGGWREILVEDRRSTPAEIASSRIDFEGWLERLPRRQRSVAELLAMGESTKLVAHRMSLTPGRISQLRRQLHQSWCQWQGYVTADTNVSHAVI